MNKGLKFVGWHELCILSNSPHLVCLLTFNKQLRNSPLIGIREKEDQPDYDFIFVIHEGVRRGSRRRCVCALPFPASRGRRCRNVIFIQLGRFSCYGDTVTGLVRLWWRWVFVGQVLVSAVVEIVVSVLTLAWQGVLYVFVVVYVSVCGGRVCRCRIVVLLFVGLATAVRTVTVVTLYFTAAWLSRRRRRRLWRRV